MAIISQVMVWVFAPLAVVFGHLAVRQIRTSGEGGAGLAKASLILGYVFTGLALLGCIIATTGALMSIGTSPTSP
jgi:hypothetical protein